LITLLKRFFRHENGVTRFGVRLKKKKLCVCLNGGCKRMRKRRYHEASFTNGGC